jgi:ABC-2 type transport system permease protein
VRAWWAQTRAEVTMTIRRGETLLLTVGIPVLLLAFFTETKVASTGTTSRIDFFAPGVLALCVMSTSFVALSIATGFERSSGVLRRLHVTPLGRGRLIGAKIAAVLLVEGIQVAVVSAEAAALGWTPRGGAGAVAAAIGVMVLATIGFAGVGLAFAGWLRAEVNLGAANGLYVVLLLVSGFVVPVGDLPHALANVIVGTPSGALADALHRVLGAGRVVGAADLISLAAWAVAAPVLAARTFRFA